MGIEYASSIHWIYLFALRNLNTILSVINNYRYEKRHAGLDPASRKKDYSKAGLRRLASVTWVLAGMTNYDPVSFAGMHNMKLFISFSMINRGQ